MKMNNSKLTTSEYFLKKYRMQQEHFHFNRQAFLDEFKEYFLEQVNNYPELNPKTGCITYNTFKRILSETETLWANISNKANKPLSKGLWNAFFAQTIVPFRKAMFPRVQDKINSLKARTLGDPKTKARILEKLYGHK